MNNAKHDVTKLPKWAQDQLANAERRAASTGHHSIQNCSFQTVGVKHDERSAGAIEAVARALEANAKAASELAKALSGSSVQTGPAIQIGGPQ